MSRPLAFLLTWTTHGTHLHGDARGSVDLLHNRRGTPTLAPDPERERQNRTITRNGPIVLHPTQRAVVESAIRDHSDVRRWEVRASSVRSNHAHVVVDCRSAPVFPEPELVMEQYKYWGTRRLRDSGWYAHPQRVWTDHGSTRWINHQAGLSAAIDYVLNSQDDPDRFREEARSREFLAYLDQLDDAWRKECAERRAAMERGEYEHPSEVAGPDLGLHGDSTPARAEGS